MQNPQDSPTSALPRPENSNGGESMLMEAMFEQAQWFGRMWSDMAVRMANAAAKTDTTAPPPEAMRQARSAMFQAMAQTADEYMRMPQFLELMKQSMEMGTAFRKQMNDFLTSMHHNAQGIAKQDIDQLMLSVRHMETRVLEAMEQISARLENLSSRLSALEGNKSTAAPAGSQPSAAPPPASPPISPPASPIASPPAASTSPSTSPATNPASSGSEEVVARAAKRPTKRPREEGPKA